MEGKRKILFIVNPIAGTAGKEGMAEAIAAAIDRSYYDFDIARTAYGGHAAELASKARDEGAFCVVAVGGDGTVNEVARSLVHSDTALGIIPCGSGNGLARHLMLPSDPREAVGVINMHTVHDLDYGLINGHPFFCTCGMGFDAFVSVKFAEAGRRGLMAYLENILREGLKYKPETYEITDGGGTTLCRAFLISCANASQYGNNAYIAPQASMSDGLLDVTVMEPFDMLEAPQISIDMFNKTLDKNRNIKTFKTKHIRVGRQQPGFIHYDGDPVMAAADVDISVVSRGIKMIVNPLARKSRRRPGRVQTAFSLFFNDLLATGADRLKAARHMDLKDRIMPGKDGDAKDKGE